MPPSREWAGSLGEGVLVLGSKPCRLWAPPYPQHIRTHLAGPTMPSEGHAVASAAIYNETLITAGRALKCGTERAKRVIWHLVVVSTKLCLEVNSI